MRRLLRIADPMRPVFWAILATEISVCLSLLS